MYAHQHAKRAEALPWRQTVVPPNLTQATAIGVGLGQLLLIAIAAVLIVLVVDAIRIHRRTRRVAAAHLLPEGRVTYSNPVFAPALRYQFHLAQSYCK